jgi:hypothetical protein
MEGLMKGDGSKMKMEKSLIGIAGEYAVASELCRRGIYAQLTLGNRKKVDLLIDGATLARIEVKTKQGRGWPGVKGISPKDGLKFLVLVDLRSKQGDERPDFYVIGPDEWRPFLEEKVKDQLERKVVKIDDDSIPVYRSRFIGTEIRIEDVQRFKNGWEKIQRAVGPTRE